MQRLHDNAQAYGDRPASMARRAKGRRCSRAWRCAVDVADGWRSATTSATARSCRSTSASARASSTRRAICQRIVGRVLDRAIGDLLVETVSPLALEVALAVQDELEARAQEVDRIRRQQVERARYEADLAQRRYLRVDPDNRLVADSLEAEWNHKLRALVAAQEDYERKRD